MLNSEVMNLLSVMFWLSILTGMPEKMNILHITQIVFYIGSKDHPAGSV